MSEASGRTHCCRWIVMGSSSLHNRRDEDRTVLVHNNGTWRILHTEMSACYSTSCISATKGCDKIIIGCLDNPCNHGRSICYQTPVWSTWIDCHNGICNSWENLHHGYYCSSPRLQAHPSLHVDIRYSPKRNEISMTSHHMAHENHSHLYANALRITSILHDPRSTRSQFMSSALIFKLHPLLIPRFRCGAAAELQLISELQHLDAETGLTIYLLMIPN